MDCGRRRKIGLETVRGGASALLRRWRRRGREAGRQRRLEAAFARAGFCPTAVYAQGEGPSLARLTLFVDAASRRLAFSAADGMPRYMAFDQLLSCSVAESFRGTAVWEDGERRTRVQVTAMDLTLLLRDVRRPGLVVPLLRGEPLEAGSARYTACRALANRLAAALEDIIASGSGRG